MMKSGLDEGLSSGKFENLAKDVRVLIIEAPYYKDIVEVLVARTKKILAENNCLYEIVSVKGALEIPQAFAAAVSGQLFCATKAHYHGVVALGCVIRGQTSHYEIVCQNTNFWLMDIAIRNSIPFGNGILTVDTYDQARERAMGINAPSKGEDAAHACLDLIALNKKFAQGR